MCVSSGTGRPKAGRLSRRLFVAALPLVLAGCMKTGSVVQAVAPLGPDPYYVAMYGAKPDEQFPLPATDIRQVDDRFFRQQVDYHRSEPPGTVVVDTANRFLFLVQEGGKAMRYGIGVGQQGLEFEGTARIGYKREWPRWTPTQSMIARNPERYAQHAGGMEPGLTNPLGPRALYLFKDGVDTLYRIHGTSEPWSIGLAVSSGCIRLFNQDIIDLYTRVPADSVVVVLQNEPLLYPQREVPQWVARQIGGGQAQPVATPPPAGQQAGTALPPLAADAAQPRRPVLGILGI